MRILLTTILILSLATLGFGQLFDTTTYHKDLSSYVKVDDVLHMRFNKTNEDTLLKFGHRIQDAFIETPISLHTGRIASPSKPLEYQTPTTDQFQLSTPLFGNWFYNPDSLLYHQSQTPRTDLTYAQGTGNLLHLAASHSQNIASNWSFGLIYNRTKSHNLFHNNLPAFNQERMTNLFSTGVYSHFYTPNRKYEVFANFINSKNTVKETFGITNPEEFDQLSGRAKTFAGEANFYDASNLFIDRTWSVTQFFRPGKRTIQINDTTIGPDTNTSNITSQWFHQFRYRRHINRFTDGDPNIDLFPTRFVSLETHDSIFHSVLSNKIGKALHVKSMLTKIWMLHEAIQVKQHYFHSSSFNHVRFGGDVNKSVKNSTHYAYAHGSALGYYSGDFKGLYRFESLLNRIDLHSEVSMTRRRPDYNEQFFGSNNYYWNKSLNRTLTSQIAGRISNKKSTRVLNVDFYDIDQFVYYDSTGVAQQLDDHVQYLRANAVFQFRLGSSWYWRNRVTYQWTSNKVLALPAVSVKTRLYKEGYLFNKNMWARIGVDVQYFTPYTGTTYNPIVRQMTLSNKEIGGFPIVDVFINSEVRSMELYVSTHHIAQGYFINDSFMASDYVFIGRTFQFGVNWRLFD